MRGIIENIKQQRKENQNVRQSVEGKQRIKEFFAEAYNNLKVWNQLPINEVNMEKFFFMVSGFIKFNNISLNSIAVYPCLCAQANFETNDLFQISQNNISKMAGISINSVMKGINDMTDSGYSLVYNDESEGEMHYPILEKFKVLTGKQHPYQYRVQFIRKHHIESWGNKFIFHTCIIDSGIWAKLDPRAKALYIVMRSTAKFNGRLYCKVEGITYSEEDWFDEGYRNRKWDICETSLTELCRMVGGGLDDNNRGKGMSSSNIQIIVKQLEHYGLIMKVNNQFMVYLKPEICRNGDTYNE